MKFSKEFLILVLATGLTSCSKLKDMSDNAEAAKDNSGRAADAAQESREEIANGRLLTRSGGASLARREALEALKKWESFEMKVTEGSKFVKALEFQTWTGQKYDDESYLESLRVDGVREFFRATYELNGGEETTLEDLSPFQLKEKNKAQNLSVLALAVAMHGIHNYQEHVSSKDDEAISLYELLKRSLREIKKVEEGTIGYDDLKPHQQIVYEYKNVAIAMTKARLNMFMTMSLIKTTNLNDKGLIGLGALLKTKKMGKLEAKFLKLHLGQQNAANKYLDAAIKVKVFLEEIGESTELFEDLVKLYGKVELGQSNDFNQPNYDSSEEAKEHAEYLINMNNFFEWTSGSFKPKK